MSNSNGADSHKVTESPPPPPAALDLESGVVGGDATIMLNPDGPNTQKVTKSHSPPPAPVDLESRAVDGDTTIISNPDGPNTQKVTESLPPPPAAVDLESRAVGSGAALSIVQTQRWKREDFLKKCLLASRGLGFVFSFLAYVIMASNKHGDWKEYDRYEEYRYLVEISILSALYTGLQSLRQIHEISTGKEMFSRRILALVDFCGDQILAYLLISVASSAVALTNTIREWSNNAFTNESTTSTSMEFFAFFALAFSSLISGYMLSQQFCI